MSTRRPPTVVKTRRHAEIDAIRADLTERWKRPVTRREAVDAAIIQTLRMVRAGWAPDPALLTDTYVPLGRPPKETP